MDKKIRQDPETGLWATEDGMVLREVNQFKRGPNGAYRGVSNGKGDKQSVHRIVARAYLPNPENKSCVCHKDDDPSNNRVSNLYWGTHQENIQDMLTKGRGKPWGNKKRQPNLQQWETVYQLIYQGYSNREIGEELGVTESRISQIISYMRSRGYEIPMGNARKFLKEL